MTGSSLTRGPPVTPMPIPSVRSRWRPTFSSPIPQSQVPPPLSASWTMPFHRQTAAVLSYCQRSGFTHTHVRLIIRCWRSEFQHGSAGLRSFWRLSEGKIHVLAFPAWSTVLHSVAHGPLPPASEPATSRLSDPFFIPTWLSLTTAGRGSPLLRTPMTRLGPPG